MNNILLLIIIIILNPNCPDIDECTEGTAACGDLCHNTNGSYYCSCSGAGYRLQNDNVSCESELLQLYYYYSYGLNGLKLIRCAWTRKSTLQTCCMK